MADLIKLSKLQLPINDNSLSQLQSYQKSEHKLLDGIREASDEILKLYDTLTGKTEMQGGQNLSGNGIMNAAQSIITGQTALENGSKFLERVPFCRKIKVHRQVRIYSQMQTKTFETVC